MKNRFTSPYNLPFLANLKRERESMIDSLINNLKLTDVEKDEAFIKTVERIKKSVVLIPAEIGAGRVAYHEFEQREMTMQMQLLGAPSSFYHHEVVFQVTGSSELFSHTPEQGFSYSSSDHGLILPSGRQLTVYASLPKLENEKAIAAAEQLLIMTKQFVNNNNATVKPWNAAIEARIDQQAQAKRKELIDMFGGK